MERLDVNSIVSGKPDRETRRFSMTSAERGRPGRKEAALGPVVGWEGWRVVLGPSQPRKVSEMVTSGSKYTEWSAVRSCCCSPSSPASSSASWPPPLLSPALPPPAADMAAVASHLSLYSSIILSMVSSTRETSLSASLSPAGMRLDVASMMVRPDILFIVFLKLLTR